MDAPRSATESTKLQSSDPVLTEFIRAEIERRGAVSFAWFMEQALYHPAHGYYAADRCAIGRDGDYFTNVSVGAVFGRLLTAQFFEIWNKLQRPADFLIVEQGAHHGQFGRDVLDASRRHWPDFFKALRFGIVEPFPALRQRQSETLEEFSDKIFWHDSLGALAPIAGIHFSNELLDSFPVHVMVSGGRGGRWLERHVGLEQDRFVFVDRPVNDARVSRQLAMFECPNDSRETQIEINLAALDWIDAVSTKLERGFILMVDYGHARDQWPSAGSLQCRSRHRLLDSPFEAIGRSDISAHVDWTGIAVRAQEAGLRLNGFADQHHFLTGILSELSTDETVNRTPTAEAGPNLSRLVGASDQAGLRTLLHPEVMGRSFQLLSLSKNVDSGTTLAGFKFARDPRTALGLSK